jgi:hypothetical protein
MLLSKAKTWTVAGSIVLGVVLSVLLVLHATETVATEGGDDIPVCVLPDRELVVRIADGKDWNPASVRFDSQSFEADVDAGMDVKGAIDSNVLGSNAREFPIDLAALEAVLNSGKSILLPWDSFVAPEDPHIVVSVHDGWLEYEAGGEPPDGGRLFVNGSIWGGRQRPGIIKQLAYEISDVEQGGEEIFYPTPIIERQPGSMDVVFRFLQQDERPEFEWHWVARANEEGGYHIIPLELPSMLLE